MTQRLVKVITIIVCGVPGGALTLIGLNFIIVAADGRAELPRWEVYLIGFIALSLAAVFFTLIWVSLGGLSSALRLPQGRVSTGRNGANS